MIAALGASSRLSTVANAAAAGAFAAYVGVGLAGAGDLGSYNLALDNDGFGGGAVVGCPAYEEVRQPTMDGFDLNKYEGLWYEQAYHDYTQFSEVETRGGRCRVVVSSPPRRRGGGFASSRLRVGDAAGGSHATGGRRGRVRLDVGDATTGARAGGGVGSSCVGGRGTATRAANHLLWGARDRDARRQPPSEHAPSGSDVSHIAKRVETVPWCRLRCDVLIANA